MLITRLAAILLICTNATNAIAADSTTIRTNPTITLKTVTNGATCTNKGEIGQTSSGNYTSCVSGKWQAQEIYNPVQVTSASVYIAPNTAKNAYVACPSGKKAFLSACSLTNVSGHTFWYDGSGLADGLDPVTTWHIAGDKGAFCLYQASPTGSAYVQSIALCGDR